MLRVWGGGIFYPDVTQISNPEQIEITFDPAHEVNLTWEK